MGTSVMESLTESPKDASPEAAEKDERAGEASAQGEAEALLALADATRHPVLARLLAGSEGHVLHAELLDLLAPQFRLRAPRRYVRVMARLRGPHYDEPVLLTDVSSTGVRLLIQSDVPLDLTQFGNMSLLVRTSRGPRDLAVALVRRCGGDERHTDLACRFLPSADPAGAADEDLTAVVAELRSLIFGAA